MNDRTAFKLPSLRPSSHYYSSSSMCKILSSVSYLWLLPSLLLLLSMATCTFPTIVQSNATTTISLNGFLHPTETSITRWQVTSTSNHPISKSVELKSTTKLTPNTILASNLQYEYLTQPPTALASVFLSVEHSLTNPSSTKQLKSTLTTTSPTSTFLSSATASPSEIYIPPRTTYKCPTQCDCFNVDETIDCSHRGLNLLPSFSFNTKRLYLEDNRVAHIALDSFSSAPELLLIVLERNEVSHVDTASFCGLMKLQELDLGGNRIQSFVVTSYNSDQNIQDDNSHDQNIDDSTLNKSCRLPNLKEINLSLNLLAIVPKFLSAFAPNLEILNLSYNEIEIVAVDESYSSLKFLKHLDLSRNKIHWISQDDLKPLSFTSLEILNLAECGVTGVEPNSFDGLNGLSSLSLANNLLSPADVCSILKSFAKNRNTTTTNSDKLKDPQKNLSTQNIVHNNDSFFSNNFGRKNSNTNKDTDYLDKIKENKSDEMYVEMYDDVEKDDGKNYNTLTRLDLSEIALPNITGEMLGPFKHLAILDLSICDVEWIEPELFAQLANLETLHLEFGKLAELNNLAFHKKLRRLYLQDNKLKYINVTGVYTLETLDLSYNKLESIPKDWLVGLRNLQILNLSHNNIISLDWNAFKQSSIMLTLDISFNKITSLSNFGLNRLTKIDASHNCISSLDVNTFEHLHQTITGIDLSYNNISTFDSQIFKQTHNLQSLNLAYNKLFKWSNVDVNDNNNNNIDVTINNNGDENNYPNYISPFTNLQLLKNLDLSGNELTKLTCQTFVPLRNVLKVSLRDNKFTDVKNTGVNCARSLVKLILSNNRMTTADVTILDSMLSLEELDISSNPFNCDCNIVPFLRWANETRVRIIKEVETDSYKCHYDLSNQQQQQQQQQNSLSSNYAYINDNSDDDKNFLFSYRPELDNCFDINSRTQQKYDSYVSNIDSMLPTSLQYQNLDRDKDINSYSAKTGSIKYFSVFCLTTLAGIFIGMTVIFVAWRFRTSVYTIKCFSPRWRRVRYREVADDLESALDSRV